MTIKTPSLFTSGEASGEADEGGAPGVDPGQSLTEFDGSGSHAVGSIGVGTGEDFTAEDSFDFLGSDQMLSEPVFGVMDESNLDSLVAESVYGSEEQQNEILDEDMQCSTLVDNVLSRHACK